MKTFVAAALGAFVSASEHEHRFMQWIANFGRSYGTVEEYKFRLEQFMNIDKHIEEHNAKEGETYTLGHNQFSDYTKAEYRKMLGYKPSTMPTEPAPAFDAENVSYPSSVDWVTAGAVTPVKNQGQCGSCWTFSSTGALEGMYKIFHGTLYSLSEQQLVNCVQLCYGCNGGNTSIVFGYYSNSHYSYTEAEWPYTSYYGQSGSCTYPASSPSPVRSGGNVNVEANSEAAMKTAIAQQPVSIAIEADQYSFQSYSGGVFTGPCGTALDHAVLLVGYGTSNGQEYYLMKNSWGTTWGDQGYMKMAITGNGPGTCGCQMQGNYPQH